VGARHETAHFHRRRDFAAAAIQEVRALRPILVAGAGKIGATIADLLAATGDYAVTIADASETQLDALELATQVKRRRIDVRDPAALDAALAGAFAVMSAVPFHLTSGIAEAATRSDVHYLDLTEDVASTRRVRALAAEARRAVIPQCGLAPGFVSIVAGDLARGFESLDAVRLRTGALPRYPSNALGYNLTWSTEGVINEYCEPCEAIVDGKLIAVPALEGLEELALDGTRYEAFNTSGGLGSLCETLGGRLRTLDYRSIRYPGHRALIKALRDDLRLGERRDLLKDILEHAVPGTMQDVVVVFVTVSGRKAGRLMQETYANRIHGRAVGGLPRSAIQLTTAASACAVLDLLADGEIPSRGFVRQEEIALDRFLANRFGRVYARPEDIPAEEVASVARAISPELELI
jgi:saccharopine dehydrogenase-like NADP-dependent oxidoreductase